jgi:hypothetical protein
MIRTESPSRVCDTDKTDGINQLHRTILETSHKGKEKSFYDWWAYWGKKRIYKASK